MVQNTKSGFRLICRKLTSTNGKIAIGPSFLMLLGIHWGQFPELWEIEGGVSDKKAQKESLVTEGKYVRGLSGMTCVIPAEDIMSLLNSDDIREPREKHERMLMQ